MIFDVFVNLGVLIRKGIYPECKLNVKISLKDQKAKIIENLKKFAGLAMTYGKYM